MIGIKPESHSETSSAVNWAEKLTICGKKLFRFTHHLLIKQETSFGFLHYAVVTCSAVLEEYTASIFRVIEWVKWRLHMMV